MRAKGNSTAAPDLSPIDSQAGEGALPSQIPNKNPTAHRTTSPPASTTPPHDGHGQPSDTGSQVLSTLPALAQLLARKAAAEFVGTKNTGLAKDRLGRATPASEEENHNHAQNNDLDQ